MGIFQDRKDEKMAKGCRYGSHRVIDPPGSLPQRAKKINNSTDIYDNEILVDVETLNIDAASFTQLEEEAKGDLKKIASRILEIVAERGKILPRRLTGTCAPHQRELTRAIKQARNIALLPFAAEA